LIVGSTFSSSARRAVVPRIVSKLRAHLAARVVAVLDARDVDDFDRIAKKILAAFEAPADPR
jgi:hypothetical protein